MGLGSTGNVDSSDAAAQGFPAAAGGGTGNNSIAATRQPPPQPLLRIHDLWHGFPGSDWVLRGIDLTLMQGELVGLLGPSGCGKTTLLRLIAGFEAPRRGQIRQGSRLISSPATLLPPERRGIGMVFQDDALFPHLTAWQNACFGIPAGLDRSRASWLLELLGLHGLEQRYPHELSGGQRQRLAMARALAPAPRLVLMDEPFSNLDVEVRLRLRSELPGVLARCGASGVMVTHDPEESLAICSRVAVLQGGLLQQCADPRHLVDRPSTAFVAAFVLQANLLPARAEGCQRVITPLGSFVSPEPFQNNSAEPLQVLVRPQQLRLVASPAGPAHVVAREFLGEQWLYRLDLNGLPLKLRQPLSKELTLNQRCRVAVDPAARCLLYPQQASLALEASADGA